ncbi:MAG: mechanosensitive ion channel family protein [Devosia sp.]
MDDGTFLGISLAWVLQYAWAVVISLGVLVAGWMIANIVSGWVAALIHTRLKRDVTIGPLVGQIVRYGILFITVVIVLGQFGVQTASILAVLGAAGLAIALALQGTLANIAAGIMLVFLRPFNVGDYIDADGIVGTVIEVGLFATHLRTQDGVFVFAPNAKLSNARITNFTRERSRVVELTFKVPRSADLGQVRSVVNAAMTPDPKEAGGPPELLVDALDDAAVTLVARVPVRSGDWRQSKSKLQERLKTALDRANNFAPADAV